MFFLSPRQKDHKKTSLTHNIIYNYYFEQWSRILLYVKTSLKTNILFSIPYHCATMEIIFKQRQILQNKLYFTHTKNSILNCISI